MITSEIRPAAPSNHNVQSTQVHNDSLEHTHYDQAVSVDTIPRPSVFTGTTVTQQALERSIVEHTSSTSATDTNSALVIQRPSGKRPAIRSRAAKKTTPFVHMASKLPIPYPGIPTGKSSTSRRLLMAHISPAMLKATKSLVTNVDDRQSVRIHQDPEVLMEHIQFSAVAAPAGLKAYHFSKLPADLLPYTHDGTLHIMMIEGNGTGFAGPTNNPKLGQQIMLNNYADAAHDLRKEVEFPLVLTGCSGREGTSGNNPMMMEKLHIADEFYQAFTNPDPTSGLPPIKTHILTLDKIIPNYRLMIVAADTKYKAALEGPTKFRDTKLAELQPKKEEIKGIKTEIKAVKKQIEEMGPNADSARINAKEIELDWLETDLESREDKYDAKKAAIEEEFYQATDQDFKNWLRECADAVTTAKAYATKNFKWPSDQKTAVVMPGYSSEFSEFLELDNDGNTTLFGRPLDLLVNDRAAGNIEARTGKQMTNVRVMNACYKEGQDKAAMAKAWNSFIKDKAVDLKNEGLDVHGLCEPIRYKLVERPELQGKMQIEELIELDTKTLADAIEDVLINGLDLNGEGEKEIVEESMMKSSGTGKGDGIRSAKRSMIFNRDGSFRDGYKTRITTIARGSVREVYQKYRGGAGMPYMIQKRVDIKRIEGGRHDGMTFDYRHVVTRYKDPKDGKVYIAAFPSVAKVASEEDALVNNTSAGMAKHGKSGSDFLIPLCGEGAEEAGLDHDTMKKVGRVLAYQVAHMLEKNYLTSTQEPDSRQP